MLLKRVKYALRITTAAYDPELASLIMAAAEDLKTSAGVPVEGVSITVSWSSATPTVTDNSTITDELVIRTIIAYVRSNFGSPADIDKVKNAYDEMKSQLQRATGYGIPEDEDDE